MSMSDDSNNDDRFNEILLEYLRKEDAGEPVDQRAFIAAHPEYSERLREYFEDSAAMSGMLGAGGEVCASLVSDTHCVSVLS